MPGSVELGSADGSGDADGSALGGILPGSLVGALLAGGGGGSGCDGEVPGSPKHPAISMPTKPNPERGAKRRIDLNEPSRCDREVAL